MRRTDLQVRRRETSGKGPARAMRREGLIPGVVYGRGETPLSIAVDRHTIEHALHVGGESENILVHLELEDAQTKVLALIRDTQHDPLTGSLQHLDFYRVSLDRPITTTVPLHTIGNPKGVREGGVFELMIRDVEIECLPLNIPDFIEIDVTNLDIGFSLHISDLPENPDYTVKTAKDRAIASVAHPIKEVVPAEVAAAEAAAAETPEAETASKTSAKE